MSVGRGEFYIKAHNADSPPVSAQRIAGSPSSSTLENGRNTHAAGRANRDQSALGAVFIENFCERGDDARAGSREGMADCKAASLHIELGPIDGAQGARQSEFVAAENRVGPRLECA